VEMLRKEEAAPKTIAFYLYPAELFSKFCHKNLNEITPEDVYAWRDELGFTPYCRQDCVGAIKSVLIPCHRLVGI
jgi:hypothetical protein